MRAQLARRRAAERAGVPRLGWKLAFHDPAFQRRLGLAGPLAGALPGDAVLAPGATICPDAGARLAVEAEIAIRVAAAPASQGGVVIASVAPALEVVDYGLPADDLETLVAHSFFHFASVFGAERPFDAKLRPADCVRRVLRNDELQPGVDPALTPRSLPGVLDTVASLLRSHGEDLLPGDRILSGSLVQPLRVRPGDRVRVDFGAWDELSLRIAPAA
jgi:2-keto-4-pentenoate hydratase